jgi:hypothetical protein
MVFWTIVFIIFYLSLLLKGSPFYKKRIEYGELEIKKFEGGDKEELSTQQMKTIGFPFVCLWCLIIVEIFYLGSALDNDPNKYPTIVAMLILVLNVLLSKNSNNDDLSKEEDMRKYKVKLYKTKRWSFKGVTSNLIYLTYFCYMFYILVF